ncbi:transcriptional regulator [Hassallia byssoidea VB512170]|uniref:Transcriptional regulator n=1 Tax=Hassallia byssoidea VB512170 TaxID=1304833 RepID=A0A846H402_9CYAN|nr:transcription regulator with HTH domain protein [Hassalia byssoidea]NEU71309.1 transcriptional regulator [Hassalia byssoidea VB512170]
MTRTFNPESYGKLLAEYQPKIITTEEENEQAIALALTLEHRSNRTPEEEMLLQLLVTLIEQFEETHYPILQGTPHSMLVHLMDARDTTTEALAEVIGSLEIALQIVNGDRTINKTQAEALADYFHVDVSLFTYDKAMNLD